MDWTRSLPGRPDRAPLDGDAGEWLARAAELRRSAELDTALLYGLRALRLAPQDADVWSTLGTLWLRLGHFEQALRCHRNAIVIGPGRPELYLEFARTLGAVGDLVQAEALLSIGLEAEPGHAELLFERACIRLQLGHYAQAWSDFDARLQLGPMRLPELALPRWRGEPLEGRRLLLLAETELPDVLWAMRFIVPLACHGTAITLCCPAALHPLLARLPVRLIDSLEDPVIVREHDLQCPLLSLPGLVSPRGWLIPAQAPVSVPVDSSVWFQGHDVAAGVTLRVGIACSVGRDGGDCSDRLHWRLPQLAALPGVKLFSLQQGHEGRKRHDDHQAQYPRIDAGAQSRHLGDIAAALERMDVVVANDGVVAHLAGAMGKPALVLLSSSAHWIYGHEADATPWYPTLRLLRQPEPGEWGAVLDEVQRQLVCWAYARVERVSAA